MMKRSALYSRLCRSTKASLNCTKIKFRYLIATRLKARSKPLSNVKLNYLLVARLLSTLQKRLFLLTLTLLALQKVRTLKKQQQRLTVKQQKKLLASYAYAIWADWSLSILSICTLIATSVKLRIA